MRVFEKLTNRRGGDIASGGQLEGPADVNRSPDPTRVTDELAQADRLRVDQIGQLRAASRVGSGQVAPALHKRQAIRKVKQSSAGEGAVEYGYGPGAAGDSGTSDAGDWAAGIGRAAANRKAAIKRWWTMWVAAALGWAWAINIKNIIKLHFSLKINAKR
ncbi:histone-lysine N-methyltransferase [Striga asiatica]|uniref:Histone-lysine N-methyltransferase n=1 Tax=Striga asiatica TaxID=4170 RepID=A0A5A7Q606_STRAF|nr:histone-lysine N-methyltransferase [Striga asiatica]